MITPFKKTLPRDNWREDDQSHQYAPQSPDVSITFTESRDQTHRYYEPSSRVQTEHSQLNSVALGPITEDTNASDIGVSEAPTYRLDEPAPKTPEPFQPSRIMCIIFELAKGCMAMAPDLRASKQ